MTERQAVIKTWRLWRRYAGEPEEYNVDACPLCAYCAYVGEYCSEGCPLTKHRQKYCVNYKCFTNFLAARRRKDRKTAKKHARAVVRVLERLILSQGWKVPKRQEVPE